MTNVLLTSRLKVSDPTAMTALNTLRDRMGMKTVMAGLSREELILMQMDLAPAAARARIEELVRGTNLFLNPNKHAWRLDVDGDAPTSPAPTPGPARIWLFVYALEPDSSLLESLWRHAGATEITGLKRFCLWRFDGAPGVSFESLHQAVRTAAVVTGRTQGFLVHPAFEEGRVYVTAPNLYDVQSLLAGNQKEGSHAE